MKTTILRYLIRKSFFLFFLISAFCYCQEIDYRYFGPPFYPEQKLDKTDSLIWPLEFELSIELKDIKNLDISNQDFDASFLVSSFSTFDDNYITKSGDSISLKANDWFSIYFKDFDKSFISNSVSYKRNDYPYLMSEPIFKKQMYLVEAPFDINWNFRDFPFDKQKIKITFTTRADTSIVRLKPSNFLYSSFNSKLPSLKDGYRLTKVGVEYNYNIDDSDLILVSPENIRALVTESMNFVFTIDRKGSWLFFKLFIGGFLSYIISSLVFLIPKKEFHANVTLSVGAIFGAIGNRYFVDNIIQNVQVFTKADAVSNLVLFMVVFNILVMILQNSHQNFWSFIQSTKNALFTSYLTFLFFLSLILIW